MDGSAVGQLAASGLFEQSKGSVDLLWCLSNGEAGLEQGGFCFGDREVAGGNGFEGAVCSPEKSVIALANGGSGNAGDEGLEAAWSWTR